MPDRLSAPFLKAIEQANEDNDRFGQYDSDDWAENGAMRAVGVARSDSMRFAELLMKTYSEGLRSGWDCPACGLLLDANGDCPDGHEFDKRSAEGGRMEALLAVVELVLSTGIHLERNRWADTA